MSRLRCNRQAKGACDHHRALTRTKRKQYVCIFAGLLCCLDLTKFVHWAIRRMMRAAANANKSRLSQPIDQAC